MVTICGWCNISPAYRLVKELAFNARKFFYCCRGCRCGWRIAPLGVLSDPILFILGIVLSRIAPNTLFLLYFFFKIRDFEEKLIGTVFRYGTIGM